jgi:hypothetical protein
MAWSGFQFCVASFFAPTAVCVNNVSAVQIGTTRKDFYVSTADMARVLGVSANELSQLFRSSVFRRKKDPRDPRGVVYPVFDSVRCYCDYRRAKRTVAHEQFLEEKAGRERATRLRIEMENRRRAHELVDKRELIARLEPVVVAYREQLLCRADRLERELARSDSRKEKVRKIRAADLDALGVLSDLFKAAGQTASNGAKEKTS